MALLVHAGMQARSFYGAAQVARKNPDHILRAFKGFQADVAGWL
jgi:hypothetical protein